MDWSKTINSNKINAGKAFISKGLMHTKLVAFITQKLLAKISKYKDRGASKIKSIESYEIKKELKVIVEPCYLKYHNH